MSLIRPFRGLRPTAELAAEIASPPYDVIDSDEARAMAKGNDKSFLHVVKPEIDLEPSVDLYDDSVYGKAVENLQKFLRGSRRDLSKALGQLESGVRPKRKKTTRKKKTVAKAEA